MFETMELTSSFPRNTLKRSEALSLVLVTMYFPFSLCRNTMSKWIERKREKKNRYTRWSGSWLKSELKLCHWETSVCCCQHDFGRENRMRPSPLTHLYDLTGCIVTGPSTFDQFNSCKLMALRYVPHPCPEENTWSAPRAHPNGEVYIRI